MRQRKRNSPVYYLLMIININIIIIIIIIIIITMFELRNGDDF